MKFRELLVLTCLSLAACHGAAQPTVPEEIVAPVETFFHPQTDAVVRVNMVSLRRSQHFQSALALVPRPMADVLRRFDRIDRVVVGLQGTQDAGVVLESRMSFEEGQELLRSMVAGQVELFPVGAFRGAAIVGQDAALVELGQGRYYLGSRNSTAHLTAPAIPSALAAPRVASLLRDAQNGGESVTWIAPTLPEEARVDASLAGAVSTIGTLQIESGLELLAHVEFSDPNSCSSAQQGLQGKLAELRNSPLFMLFGPYLNGVSLRCDATTLHGRVSWTAEQVTDLLGLIGRFLN